MSDKSEEFDTPSDNSAQTESANSAKSTKSWGESFWQWPIWSLGTPSWFFYVFLVGFVVNRLFLGNEHWPHPEPPQQYTDTKFDRDVHRYLRSLKLAKENNGPSSDLQRTAPTTPSTEPREAGIDAVTTETATARYWNNIVFRLAFARESLLAANGNENDESVSEFSEAVLTAELANTKDIDQDLAAMMTRHLACDRRLLHLLTEDGSEPRDANNDASDAVTQFVKDAREAERHEVLQICSRHANELRDMRKQLRRGYPRRAFLLSSQSFDE